jgi:uncharacterized protein (DUF433 family)
MALMPHMGGEYTGVESGAMERYELLKRITFNPEIFGGKAIIRGHRLAVQHVLEMLAAGDTAETLLAAYDWLELDDVRACLLYASSVVGNEYFFAPVLAESEIAG